MLRKRPGGEIYVLITAVLVVVVVGALLAGRENGSTVSTATDRSAERAASPTSTAAVSSPTPTETVAPTATPTPTATPQPTGTPQPTATPDILAGAMLRTEDEAAAFGLDYARGLGAVEPRLVSLELHEMDDAIALLDAKTGGAPGESGTGWGADGAAGMAWLVQFDNGEFEIPSCPPPDLDAPEEERGAGHSCGTEPTAIFIIRASDGLVVAMALGPPVPL